MHTSAKRGREGDEGNATLPATPDPSLDEVTCVQVGAATDAGSEVRDAKRRAHTAEPEAQAAGGTIPAAASATVAASATAAFVPSHATSTTPALELAGGATTALSAALSTVRGVCAQVFCLFCGTSRSSRCHMGHSHIHNCGRAPSLAPKPCGPCFGGLSLS